MEDASNAEVPIESTAVKIPTSFQNQIDQTKATMRDEELRRDALQEVVNAIKDNDAFSHEERLSVRDALSDCTERIRILKSVEAEQTHYIETTIRKCSEDIVKREQLLNTLFSKPELVSHMDLMGLFSKHHDHLKRLLSDDAAPDGEESD